MFYLSDQSACTVTYHYWWCFTWVISQPHTITSNVLPEWSVCVHSHIPLLVMFYLSDQSACTATYHYWWCFTWVISQCAQPHTITGDVLPEWSVSGMCASSTTLSPQVDRLGALLWPSATLDPGQKKAGAHSDTKKTRSKLKVQAMYKNKSGELLSYTMNCYNIILQYFSDQPTKPIQRNFVHQILLLIKTCHLVLCSKDWLVGIICTFGQALHKPR